MALVSAGIEITVTDESQYVPGAVGTVPLIIMATAQDKTNPSGGSATDTTAARAGKLSRGADRRARDAGQSLLRSQLPSAGDKLTRSGRLEVQTTYKRCKKLCASTVQQPGSDQLLGKQALF